jgi:hypothetical protein
VRGIPGSKFEEKNTNLEQDRLSWRPPFYGSRFLFSSDDPSTSRSAEPRMVEREQRGAQPISHAGAGLAVTFQRAFMGRTNTWPG